MASSSSAPPPSKRPRLITDTSTDAPPVKRRKLPPIARQQIDPDAAGVLPDEVVSIMLQQGVGLILRSHGFEDASTMALEHVRKLAEDFMLSLTQQSMLYAQTQRRSQPTVIDCAKALKNSHISIASLEDEVTRYRKSLPKARRKPFIYHIGSPLPSTVPTYEDLLPELLGPDLIEPRTQVKLAAKPPAAVWQQFAEIHKPPVSPSTPNVNLRPFAPKTSTVITERPYIEVHHPQLPSKHTYLRTEIFAFDRKKDQREIREQATEEARTAGETLRKLLAQFSKVKMKGAVGEAEGTVVKKNAIPGAVATKMGDRRKQTRDSAWQQVWSEVSAAAIAATDSTVNGDREEGRDLTNGTRPSVLGGDPEGRKTEAESKGWLDVVVNSEKDLWRKGTMTRSLRKDYVKA